MPAMILTPEGWIPYKAFNQKDVEEGRLTDLELKEWEENTAPLLTAFLTLIDRKL